MPINHYSEEDQINQLGLNEYNNKNTNAKIPVVPRNLETGWPLIQFSFLTHAVNEPGYEPILGGGKCHDTSLGLFYLARLFSKVAGTIITDPPDMKFDAYHANNLLHDYEFNHVDLGLKFKCERGIYGYKSTIDWGDLDISLLLDSRLMTKERNYQGIQLGYDEKIKSPQSIRDSINDKNSVFIHGQIFADCGLLLNSAKEAYANNPEELKKITQLEAKLKDVFKVDEFNKLKANNPNAKPSWTIEDEIKQEIKIEQDFRGKAQKKQDKKNKYDFNDINNFKKQIANELQPLAQHEKLDCLNSLANILNEHYQEKLKVLYDQKHNDPEAEVQPWFELYKKIKKQHEQLKQEPIAGNKEIKELPTDLKNHLDILRSKIKEMALYGQKIKKQDPTKGSEVESLAEELFKDIKAYESDFANHKLSDAKALTFWDDFKQKLHGKDDLIKSHREKWKPIIANIMIALIPIIGAILIIVQHAKHNEFFFAKTKSQKHIDTIDELIPKNPKST